MVGGQRPFNDYFREIVNRFGFEDALLLDRPRQRRLQRLQGRRPGHQHPDRARIGRDNLPTPTTRPCESNAVDFVGVTDFARLPARRRADGLDGVAGRAGQGNVERRNGAAVADLEDQPADDRRQAVADVRHGQDRRNVLAGPDD